MYYELPTFIHKKSVAYDCYYTMYVVYCNKMLIILLITKISKTQICEV